VTKVAGLNGHGGGGATRPLPRDGGVEEFHGDSTVGFRPSLHQPFCTNVSPPQRGGAVSALLPRGEPKWRDNYPEGFNHAVAPNCLIGHRSVRFSHTIFRVSIPGQSVSCITVKLHFQERSSAIRTKETNT